MASPGEQYESRNFTVSGNIVRGERVFLVEATTPQTALLDPIVPQYNSEFEFTPGTKAFVHNIVVERYAPTICKVTCQYDNDGSSRGPQLPDDEDPLYKDINVSYTRDTEKIPAFLLFYDRFGLGPDGTGPFDYNERWEPYDFTVDWYYATAEVTVNLPNMSAGIQRLIAQQVNSIHRFPDGLKWQFIGATTTRQQENQWQITYRWVHDPGQPAGFVNPIITPEGTTLPIAADRNLVTEGSLIVPTIARQPFEKWRVLPASDIGDRPMVGIVPFDTFRAYQPTGYQTLPGGPIP